MSKVIFGVDLGGTTVKMGLFRPDGNLLDKWEIPTRKENNGEKILPDIAKAIRDKMREKSLSNDEVIGVGIGVPGPVDAKGTVYGTTNIGWGVFSVKETLGKMLDGMEVEVGNDANVAALGELWCGGGKGYKNMVAVTLGTGVGGGIIIDNVVLTGATGAGGEIGHIHVQDDEPEACGCGNHGCLEQYASATGIHRLAVRRLAEDDMPSVLRGTKLNAKDVFDAVKAGDEVAKEIARRFGNYLAKGLSAIACVVNPEIFVIGGGVSKAGEVLFDYILDDYKKYAFPADKDVKFALATLGNDAGIYGAAHLVQIQ